MSLKYTLSLSAEEFDYLMTINSLVAGNNSMDLPDRYSPLEYPEARFEHKPTVKALELANSLRERTLKQVADNPVAGCDRWYSRMTPENTIGRWAHVKIRKTQKAKGNPRRDVFMEYQGPVTKVEKIGDRYRVTLGDGYVIPENLTLLDMENLFVDKIVIIDERHDRR